MASAFRAQGLVKKRLPLWRRLEEKLARSYERNVALHDQVRAMKRKMQERGVLTLEKKVLALKAQNRALRQELEAMKEESQRRFIVDRLADVDGKFRRKPVTQRGTLRFTINEASIVIDALEAVKGSLYTQRSINSAARKIRTAWKDAVQNHAAMRGKSLEELRSAEVRKAIEDGAYRQRDEQTERILSLRNG